MKYNIAVNVNGLQYETSVEANESLNDVLREHLKLTGTKRGCDMGGCGVCSVHIDGKLFYSCMVLAVKANGHRVTTVEGLERNGELSPVQKAFLEHGGSQCGYCTPGLIMAAEALLKENPNPTEEEIKEGLSGNLCRCTGYVKVIESVLAAAKLK